MTQDHGVCQKELSVFKVPLHHRSTPCECWSGPLSKSLLSPGNAGQPGLWERKDSISERTGVTMASEISYPPTSNVTELEQNPAGPTWERSLAPEPADLTEDLGLILEATVWSDESPESDGWMTLPPPIRKAIPCQPR